MEITMPLKSRLLDPKKWEGGGRGPFSGGEKR